MALARCNLNLVSVLLYHIFRVEDNESDEDGNDIVVESPAEESREPEPEADEEPSKPSTPMMMDEPAGLTVAKTDELFMDALARACVRTVEVCSFAYLSSRTKRKWAFLLQGSLVKKFLSPTLFLSISKIARIRRFGTLF